MKYLSIIFIVTIIWSCNRKNEEDEKVQGGEIINVINFENKLTVNKSDLFDSISVIPFKINSPIGNIEKIVFKCGNIYIWDNNREIVWGFKNNGDSLFCIDKQGKGPDEYIRIDDFSISDTDNINILDAGRKTILCYNIKGELKSSKKYNNWIHKFCSNDGYDYLFSATPPNSDGNYVDVMQKSKIIRSYFPATHIWHFNGTEFLCSADSVFFTRKFDDCIYYFKDGNLNRAYNICFGNDISFMKRLRDAMTIEENKKILKDRKYIGDIGNLSVTETHISFTYSEPFGDMIIRTNFIYNKRSKRGLSFKSYGSSEKAYFAMGTPIGSDGHYFYAIIDPTSLDESSRKKLEEIINYSLGKNLNYLLCRFLIKL